MVFLFCRVSQAQAALSVTTSVNNSTVERYGLYEITMQHPGAYSNPWWDVTVTAVFTSGTNTSTVGGFYYDTNTWKLRFAPRQTGEWSWSLVFSNSADTFTTNGNFTCVSSDHPGFLRVHPTNPYRLVTEAECKPFYPVGFGGPNMNPSDQLPLDGTWGGARKTLKVYCDTMAGGGNNLFRFNSTKWGSGWTPTADAQGRWKYDIAVGKIADYSMQQMHASKIQMMLVMLPGNPDNTNPTNQIHYFKYGINRWGAYVSIWEIMNEVFSGRPTTPAWYAALCPAIRDHDPYQHPITISFPDTNSIGMDARGRDYLDLTSPHLYLGYSSGVDQNIMSYPSGILKGGGILECKTGYPNKPIIFGEYGNTYNAIYEPGNYAANLFVSFFGEAAGVFWQAAVKASVNVNIYVGVIERGMSKTFASYLGDFDPTATLVSPAPTVSPATSGLRTYALRGNADYAAYIHYLPSPTSPVTASGKQITINVPTNNLTAMWVSTHGATKTNGMVGELLASQPVSSGSQTLAVPSFDSGILLVLKSLETAKPVLQFKACGYYLSENSGNALVQVQRLGSGSGAVSVSYHTGDGTAQSNVDYTPVAGVLTWAEGDTALKTIAVPVMNRTDTMDDYDRSFTITLTNPGGGAVLGPASMTIVGIIGLTATNGLSQTDSDGDGADDASEHLAGTDPNNRASVFKILDAFRAGPNTFDLFWPSVGGRYYSVYMSTNLSQPWSATPLATRLPGNGSALFFSDANATNPQSYYQVRAAVAP